MRASSEVRSDNPHGAAGKAAWAAWYSWASDAPGTTVRRRAETRREDEDEKREQQLRFTSQLKRNYSGSCGPAWGSPKLLRKTKIVLKLAQCALLWLLLIRVHFPQIFSFVPFGRGCTRPALDLKAGSELSTCILSPNTHTCLILVLMMVYSKCSTVSTTCTLCWEHQRQGVKTMDEEARKSNAEQAHDIDTIGS